MAHNGKPGDAPATKLSPSLRAILKEVESLYEESAHPSLYDWARQGVLLINTAHSVIRGMAGSHIELWSEFTNSVITALNKKNNLVWMLWGSHAQSYSHLITNPTHIIIKSGHPSPLNRTNPFSGCGCFSECDTELMERGITPIAWV